VAARGELCNGAIGADVSRRRKQKTLRFVVSPSELALTYKMFVFGVLRISSVGCLQSLETSLRRILSRLNNAQASLALYLLLQNFASQDSVTTQQCSSELGTVFAAPESRLLRLGCNGDVGGEKSVFTRNTNLIRTPKIPVFFYWACYVSEALVAQKSDIFVPTRLRAQ